MKFTQEWQARAICNEMPTDWFPAEVPGNVQRDYARFMNWGDINYGENCLLYKQTEKYFWEYRTVLNFNISKSEKAYFVSEGIDYRFDITIDGEIKLSHEGMFTTVELDVTDYKGHELVVKIYPHPKREGAKAFDRQEADQSVKPPVSYGWDWHPRVLVSGIWQDTYIETRDDGYIRYCEAFSKLSDDLNKADIDIKVDCDTPVEITLFDPNGNEIGKGSHYSIDKPFLWWCNGQGEQNLYSYIAKTYTHEVSGTIGLRKVRLIMNEGAWNEPSRFPKGRSVAPIQLELNGRKIFAKGSNWVNPDIFNGIIDYDRYDKLIMLAKQANMNIFRCWGGSGINKKAFYDLCDKYGIMVWAEFPLACNNYEGTANYLEVLESEARSIIRKLRQHSSVVLYCGGNELFNRWSGMTDQSLALRLLNSLCYELDRDTPFIMTSPIFGIAHGGYTFYDPDAHKDVFQLFQGAHNTAYTEFGCSAIAEKKVLQEIIPSNELFPIKKTPSWVLHHAFEAWGDERWLCMSTLSKYASSPLDTLDKVIELSNWMQCEGYKAIFEEARRQAPYCAMAINWDYDEPWKTAAGNNLIAYPDAPKPAYHAVKDALRPVLASARIPRFDWKAGDCFSAELWLLNDSPFETSKTINVRIRILGVEYNLLTWESGTVCANVNRIGPTVNWILPDVPADEITVILATGDDASSEYRLRYKPSEKVVLSRVLNM